MSIFKRFTNEKKPTKAELNSFKYRLKCGDDPMEHWVKQEEHWEKFKFHKDTTYDLLRKIYDVTEINQPNYYAKIEVWMWSSFTGDCDKSPIGKHVYINHFGDRNPHKDETPICLACERELKL